jgi:hypothetical protein
MSSVDLLKTNTLNSLWNNLIRALEKVIYVENPNLKAKERTDMFDKIAAGELKHWALPPLTLYEKVRYPAEPRERERERKGLCCTWPASTCWLG